MIFMDCINEIIDCLNNNNKLISSISNIFVCLSAIFVGIQARLFFNDSKKRNKKEGFENSFKLTSFYINEIIPKMSTISFIFNDAQIDKMFREKIKGVDLKYFDKEELDEIFGKDALEKIVHNINSIELDVLIKHLDVYNNPNLFELKRDYYEYMDTSSESNMESECNKYLKDKLVKRFMALITSAANEIEYFSMYFNSNLAESDVVYESLHQTYIDIVKMLYPFMVMRNSRNQITRRYYSNTKALYLKWTEKENQKNEKLKETLESLEQHSRKNNKI